MATRGEGGNCRMCGAYIPPGSGIGWGFTLHPSSNDEVFCSEPCRQAAKAQRSKVLKKLGGCLFAPVKLCVKVFFNKWVLTICTAGLAYFTWKGLDKIYGKNS